MLLESRNEAEGAMCVVRHMNLLASDPKQPTRTVQGTYNPIQST